jgi:putative peptide zinc metalloprotease protein
VVVAQDDVGLLRERTKAAWVRLAHDVARVYPARIVREVPAATERLPARALGTAGGGRIATDPADEDGLRTREPVFQFELALPAEAALRVAGERAYVRFDHGGEALAWRAGRAARRIFLRQLGV